MFLPPRAAAGQATLFFSLKGFLLATVELCSLRHSGTAFAGVLLGTVWKGAASILAFVFLCRSHSSATLAPHFLEKEKRCGSTISLSGTGVEDSVVHWSNRWQPRFAMHQSKHTLSIEGVPTWDSLVGKLIPASKG